jgi:hypothetical protein
MSRVLERWRPAPGVPVEDFEVPGPGLYEADFSVPGWLIPDFVTTRPISFDRDGYRIRHERTAVVGDTLTSRFRVSEVAPLSGAPLTAAVAPLTVAVVARAIFGVALGALAVGLVAGIVSGLREVRRLAETDAGAGLGIGAAAAGLGLLLLSRGRG